MGLNYIWLLFFLFCELSFLCASLSDQGCLWLDQSLLVHIQDQPVTEKVTDCVSFSIELFYFSPQCIMVISSLNHPYSTCSRATLTHTHTHTHSLDFHVIMSSSLPPPFLWIDPLETGACPSLSKLASHISVGAESCVKKKKLDSDIVFFPLWESWVAVASISYSIRDTQNKASVWKKYDIDVSVGFFLGGPLTVTDANLALGRLLPSFFPKIFGPGENEPLSLEETMKHFRHLTQEINLFLSSNQPQAGTFTEKSRRVSYFLRFSPREC